MTGQRWLLPSSPLPQLQPWLATPVSGAVQHMVAFSILALCSSWQHSGVAKSGLLPPPCTHLRAAGRLAGGAPQGSQRLWLLSSQQAGGRPPAVKLLPGPQRLRHLVIVAAHLRASQRQAGAALDPSRI